MSSGTLFAGQVNLANQPFDPNHAIRLVDYFSANPRFIVELDEAEPLSELDLPTMLFSAVIEVELDDGAAPWVGQLVLLLTGSPFQGPVFVHVTATSNNPSFELYEDDTLTTPVATLTFAPSGGSKTLIVYKLSSGLSAKEL